MAAARRESRNRDIARRPWTIASGIGGTKDADRRRARGRRDVQRTRVARHHQRRRARQREQVGKLRRRREVRSTPRRLDDRAGEWFITWAPQHECRKSPDVAQEGGDLSEL